MLTSVDNDRSGRRGPSDNQGEGRVVDGVELVRPDLAVLRLRAGDPVPSLPMRVAVPGAGDGRGPRRTVQVTEVMAAEGDDSVVALVLAEPVATTSGVSTLSAQSTVAPTAAEQTNWICRLFPKLCS